MKYFFYTILFVLFLAPQYISAQKANFDVGISTGVSLNNVHGHINDAKFQWRLSPQLYSIFIGYTKNNRIGFKAEFDYAVKGPINTKISYFNIAPMISFIFPDKNIRFSAGPYFARLNKYIANGEVQKFDFTLNYDIGYQVDFLKEFKFEGLNAFFSPQIEVGILTFSKSKHISGQFKFGILF